MKCLKVMAWHDSIGFILDYLHIYLAGYVTLQLLALVSQYPARNKSLQMTHWYFNTLMNQTLYGEGKIKEKSLAHHSNPTYVTTLLLQSY